MGNKTKVLEQSDVARFWAHEVRRTFVDRLINKEDTDWFDALLHRMCLDRMELQWDSFMPEDGRLFFGDYMVIGADVKVYDQVDTTQLVATMEEYLSEYNRDTKTPMGL